MTTPNKINFPPPKLQIDFAFALKRFRAVYLQSALLETVRDMDIAELDKQLAEYVPPADLATLAQYGLRAELLFAVPAVLEANPYLLGYYRLLMGYSQKEFYGRDKGFGVGYFKSMEEKGKTSKAAAADLPDLCVAFCATASALLAGVGPLRVSRELLDDLTLLTVGPQLRGGANNQRGTDGIVQVFEIIREIVAHAAAEVRESAIEVNSATGRPFLIEFAPDPDIIIREEMEHQHYRNVVAIEVKSGTDVSNIHNRIGEAEKSHQKARQRGFTECWTVVNVGRLDMVKARSESPSTDRFYSLAALSLRAGDDWYCKFPKNPDIAMNEVLAGKLYRLAGVRVPIVKLIEMDGDVGVASKMIPGVKTASNALTSGYVPGVNEGFAADAWLANWDVAGTGYDNLLVDPAGHAVRIDAGGSLLYRAQGAPKGSAFTDKVGEIASLRDTKNIYSSNVFKGVTKADIVAGVKKIAAIPDEKIVGLVNAEGPGGPATRLALANRLIARKKDLMARFLA